MTEAMLHAAGSRVGASAGGGLYLVPVPPRPGSAAAASGAIKPLWLVEKEAIEEAIALCNGNIPRAAALLEINPSTIYRRKAEWEKERLLSTG